MEKTKLCVLFGGKSDEYEISLRSAFTVLSHADSAKYDITTLGISKNGQWYLYTGKHEKILNNEWICDKDNLFPAQISLNPGDNSILVLGENTFEKIPVDVIFPVMHGMFAEDGTLQGCFELSAIPFVGAGCAASAICMDKVITKQILATYNIPMAQYSVITKKQLKDECDAALRLIESRFAYPIFVKPSNSGSSVGAAKVSVSSQLLPALLSASAIDEKILVEEFIDAREIEVAVLGNDNILVSECGEIDSGSEFYDYETKYIKNVSQYFIPAQLDTNTSDKIRFYAETVYQALGCKGLARIDFFVRRASGDIIFNEINTMPGFTSISMYPKLLMHGGISLPSIIDALISLAQNSDKGELS